MQRAAPPRARLTFHAAVTPAPQIALLSWPTWTPKPHEHPVGPPPTYLLDVQGAFGLEPTGGVRVAGQAVKIARQTLVSRGFGAGAKGRDGPSLWWSGTHDGQQGFYTLFLLGADDSDLLAVHRILLFLPPIRQQPIITPRSTATLTRRPPLPTHRTLGFSDPIAELQTSFARMSMVQPQYRNTLLLVDPDTDEVISIMPLESLGTFPPSQTLAEAVTSPPAPPTPPKTVSPFISHKHSPSLEKAITPDRARGQALADQVDCIVAHMSPGRPQAFAQYGDERARTRARERDGEDDGVRDGGRKAEHVDRDDVCEEDELDGYYLNRVMQDVDEHKYTNNGDEDEEMGEATLKKLARGFKLLDDEMGSLDDYSSPPLLPAARPPAKSSPATSPVSKEVQKTDFSRRTAESFSESPPPAVPQHSTSTSAFTLATIDTNSRYATVTEGPGAAESRRTSSATFSTALEQNENDGEADEATGRQEDHIYFSTEPDIPSFPPHTDPSPSPSPSASVLSAAPSHALTPSNDNSNSVLLRFFGGSSTMTARVINEEDIQREGLVPATVAAGEVESGDGWGWLSMFKGWGESSWSSWLSGWWSSSSPSTSAAPSTALPRSRPRRANGEGTGRLSVIYFDESGFGRTAYIEGSGERFGARSLGGRY